MILFIIIYYSESLTKIMVYLEEHNISTSPCTFTYSGRRLRFSIRVYSILFLYPPARVLGLQNLPLFV